MLGVLMNAAAVLLGGLIGLLFGEKIKKKYTDALLTGLALVCGVIGISYVGGCPPRSDKNWMRKGKDTRTLA